MVEPVNTYTAAARRDGHWRVVQCDQVPGAISQVARLEMAAEPLKEAIGFVTGDAGVHIRPVVSDQIMTELAEMKRLRQQADEAERAASALHRKVAIDLHQEGLTVRDIGSVLHVSYQRAHQLISS